MYQKSKEHCETYNTIIVDRKKKALETAAAQQEKELKTRLIPYYFFLLFAVVGAVNIFMVTTAISTHNGTVTNNPYEKGINYNKIIALADKQEALGFSAKLSYKDGRLNYQVNDINGKILIPEKTTAYFSRPNSDKSDFHIPISSASYALQFPKKGIWDISLHMIIEGNPFQLNERIVVK